MTVSPLFDERENSIDPVSTSPRVPDNALDQSVSLYRKYRPQSFGDDELVGQEHIVRTLRNAVALDRVAHAYLFCGPRGTGKTTTARLMAKAVNCLAEDPSRRPCNACANCIAINTGASPDIIEIDAASNRGIDDIRDLRERVRFAPAQLRSKVYIVDEAHQITGAAANAFLKTLEEPPSHTRFILATTDPEELLPTIVSRCQRFDFRRIGLEDMTRRLLQVAESENIAVTDDALRAIARHATGSMRDALGLLEQLMLQSRSGDARPIEVADVQGLLGLSRNDRIEGIVAALGNHNPGQALAVVAAAVDEGEDPRQLNRQLVAYLRLLLLERSGGNPDIDRRGKELAAKFTLSELAAHARRFGEIDFAIKHAPYPQLPLEIAIVESSLAVQPAPPTTHAPAAHTDHPGSMNKPTSLRDRVRGQSTRPVSGPESTLPPSPQAPPATITQFPSQAAPSEPFRPLPGKNEIDVDLIADLWPNIRADVKALNRRIEALLSEVDPVAVSGNQITLAVPYPFHRDKLNTDEVRETVAGVISRLLQREVVLNCVLRGEFNGAATPQAVAPQPAHSPQGEAEIDLEEEERIRMRIQAAQNIFDAEEIVDSAEFDATSASADS